MFRPEDMDAFNKDVAGWSVATKDALVQEMNSLGIVHREDSRSPVPAQQALKQNVGKKLGVASRVSFRMPRHMVFVHKGAGRGYPAAVAGTGKRQAKPWFNPVIEKEISKLTDIVADHHGAMVLNAIMIK